MSRVHRGPRALTWVLGALGEPTRRRAYEAVRQARRPVSRADVAQELGIGVRLAAFHLDKLVDEGLLSAHYARPEGRKGGPGSGRPPKWYSASSHGFDISVPPRRHDIAAMILLRSVTTSAGSSGVSPERVLQEARRCGRSLAEHSRDHDLAQLLSVLGYEPNQAPDGSIDLVNCPFHELADEDRHTTCSMNLALLQGVTEVLPGSHRAAPEQRSGFCCVRLFPENQSHPSASPDGQYGPSV
ncbi:metalloregulator ArsR/SmtB family transcription factor [Arthrobacter sp. ISL-28]|uniref:helix-turn-helix transcriptional regulator n=1 Tax=Arthrobacter sp. ISL-28 TaxID=2819108 RepID=UPI001BE55E2F|nr:transcriptional regulator [Arthrobacter sp. ISL-28]MBT2521882.1 transcriptional regulator [Arthrobacter sp. ISL-28]